MMKNISFGPFCCNKRTPGLAWLWFFYRFGNNDTWPALLAKHVCVLLFMVWGGRGQSIYTSFFYTFFSSLNFNFGWRLGEIPLLMVIMDGCVVSARYDDL